MGYAEKRLYENLMVSVEILHKSFSLKTDSVGGLYDQ